MPKPLEGYRVVDFTRVLSGPFATNMLVQLGADVIKIESHARGDSMRHYGIDEGFGDTAPPFIAVNGGKRSITLDLKNEDDLKVAGKLIGRADVVVENFRPGVMKRLGLGFEACKALKSDIIFCSISGYGQTGPWRNKPAIDQIIQSVSGLMSLSGEPGTPATRVGIPIIDTFAGTMGALAIVSALLQRQRFGGPRYIDVSMLDTSLVMMFGVIGPYLATGKRPEKQGNRGFSLSPTADTFPTKEGEITTGATRQAQFEKLSEILGRPDLPQDPRFANKNLRIENAAALREILIPLFGAHTALEWEDILNDAGIMAGAVREVPEVTAEPFMEERGMVRKVFMPALDREVKVLGPPFRFDADGPTYTNSPPPGLGEHTAEVLREIEEFNE